MAPFLIEHVNRGKKIFFNFFFLLCCCCAILELAEQAFGQPAEELTQNKELVVRAFKKCGISVAEDGSEDYEINLKEWSTSIGEPGH